MSIANICVHLYIHSITLETKGQKGRLLLAASRLFCTEPIVFHSTESVNFFLCTARKFSSANIWEKVECTTVTQLTKIIPPPSVSIHGNITEGRSTQSEPPCFQYRVQAPSILKIFFLRTPHPGPHPTPTRSRTLPSYEH